MIIDVVILIVLLVAVVFGFLKGAVQPLLAEIGFFGALLVIFRGRDGFQAFMDGHFHANAVVSVVVALVIALGLGYAGARLGGLLRRMPAVQGVDGFLGIWVQALFAVAICYVFLSALVVIDRAFAPALNNATLTVPQVEAIKRELASDALTSGLARSPDLPRLESQAKKPGGARLSETQQLSQVQGLYQDLLQPQLARSRLAPAVLGIGRHIPGVGGKVGPKDLPRPVRPSPTPKPGQPAPSPTPKKQ